METVAGLSKGTVLERVEFDSEAEVVVAHVRPRKSTRRRCGRCGHHARGYDRGEGRRRWRALDLGSVRVFLEGDAPRVECAACGVTVAEVPWARHGAGHTRHFDDTVAWLADHERVLGKFGAGRATVVRPTPGFVRSVRSAPNFRRRPPKAAN